MKDIKTFPPPFLTDPDEKLKLYFLEFYLA